MPDPKVTIDEQALKKHVDAQFAALNAEIKKEIDRKKPTDRAGLEQVVKAATGRMKGMQYPPAAQKSIVDQWVQNLGW
jgi:uncharacterized protein YpuA (DUF1002 family)